MDEQERPLILRQPWWKRLRWQAKDYASYLLYGLINVYILYSLTASIAANYRARQDIATARSNIERLKLEQAKLQSLLVYYETKSYQEIELRRRLLLKKPGETVVALQSGQPLTEQLAPEPESIQKTPLQEWYDYYFGPR